MQSVSSSLCDTMQATGKAQFALLSLCFCESASLKAPATSQTPRENQKNNIGFQLESGVSDRPNHDE